MDFKIVQSDHIPSFECIVTINVIDFQKAGVRAYAKDFLEECTKFSKTSDSLLALGSIARVLEESL